MPSATISRIGELQRSWLKCTRTVRVLSRILMKRVSGFVGRYLNKILSDSP